MRKAEKRYFKVFNSGEAKYIRLFDAMDKLNDFDEEHLLKHNKWIKREMTNQHLLFRNGFKQELLFEIK